MKIEHKRDSFLAVVFPQLEANSDDATVLKTMIEYYTFGPYKPKVTIEHDKIIVEMDDSLIITHAPIYKKVVTLCDQQRYDEAAPILTDLIAEQPMVSEYHRVLGQIRSEQGDQEVAIDHLIDALRWDSHNGWALLLMGNIYAKYKKDIDTAIQYYDQAILSNAEDYISFTNVAFLAVNNKRIEKANEYIERALNLKRNYPNALTVKAMIYEAEGDNSEAFEFYIKTMKACVKVDQVWEVAFTQAKRLAEKIVASDAGHDIVELYRKKLEYMGKKKIVIKSDDSILTPAKMEFAENHNRAHHTVIYKENYPAVDHLIMHEMAHLQFVLEAREEGENMLFTSNESHKKAFVRSVNSMTKLLTKMGIGSGAIDQFIQQIFEGQNTLMYNAPIDLFIEDMLYKEYKLFRPYQFISLHQLTHEGLKAVNDEKIIEIVPWTILAQTKVLNMVGAMQYRDLFGVDLLDQYFATPFDMKQAVKFYEEFLEYKNDKEPGEEYELIQHWAEDLEIDSFFELIDENKFRGQSTPEDVIEAVENDPYGLHDDDPRRDRDMAKFLEEQEKLGLNTAVVMFMVQAINHLRPLAADKVREIAVEIAMQGIHGYKTDGTVYRVAHVPKIKFSGYQILAWYYVSWAMAMPDKVASLQLPFEKEYEMALMMG